MNLLRIARGTLACIIVFTSFAFIFGVWIASAETGNVTVTDQSILSYTVNDGAGTAASVMNQIYIDTADYNAWESFHINLSLQSPTFALDSETTQFTCSAGGTCAGYVWYVKEYKKLYFAFTSLSVTSSPISLSYTKNILANITGMSRIKNDCSPSITQPILLYKETVVTPRCLAGLYESVTVDSTTTDNYVVTYPFSNAFTLNVTKGGSINDHWLVYDVDGNIYMDGTMDKLNFALTNNSYNGIIANVSIPSGASTIVNINVTGYPGFVTPVTPTINPFTGVGITFDARTYNIGSTANISWIRNDPTPFGYQDDIYLIQPTTTGSTVKKILVTSPSDTGYIKTNDFPIAGEYNVTFERSILGLFIEVLASDTADVVNEQPSYILVNETVPVGVYTNGTYLNGWNGTGRIVIYEDMPDGTIKEIDSLAISTTCCIEHTVSQLFFPEAGNYRVVLMKGYDTVRATASVRAYFSDIIPGRNITVSNISTNKNQYTYGEPYTITYQVDSFNYSNKAKRIIAYEPSTGANTLVTQVPAQTGSITRTFDSEMFPFSGALEFRLMGLNATGDYLLANVSFTLSKIDTEGYGLDVTKSPICSGETGFYTYYSPGSVSITMSNKDTTVYSRNFTSAVSGKTVPFTIRNPGTYEIFLRASNETDVKFTKIVEVKACDATASTTPITQAKAQNDVALLLTSSFIWALIITVGLMIAVGIEMRQQRADALIPMVAIGFLSLAAFTWLTWIPAVVFWSIVLLLAVIFAWQRAKDMNTAGE